MIISLYHVSICSHSWQLHRTRRNIGVFNVDWQGLGKVVSYCSCSEYFFKMRPDTAGIEVNCIVLDTKPEFIPQ